MTLRTLIADTLDIHMSQVETDKKWTSPDGKNAWAFLAVGSFEEATERIERIGHIGDLSLEAQWKYDSEP